MRLKKRPTEIDRTWLHVPSGTPGPPAVTLIKHCRLCGEWMEDEDRHGSLLCPMLITCELCYSIIEIKSYSQHLRDSCDRAKEKYTVCPTCNMSVPFEKLEDHRNDIYCWPAEFGTSKCQLCYKRVESTEDAWKKHLIGIDDGCEKNPRRLTFLRRQEMHAPLFSSSTEKRGTYIEGNITETQNEEEPTLHFSRQATSDEVRGTMDIDENGSEVQWFTPSTSFSFETDQRWCFPSSSYNCPQASFNEVHHIATYFEDVSGEIESEVDNPSVSFSERSHTVIGNLTFFSSHQNEYENLEVCEAVGEQSVRAPPSVSIMDDNDERSSTERNGSSDCHSWDEEDSFHSEDRDRHGVLVKEYKGKNVEKYLIVLNASFSDPERNRTDVTRFLNRRHQLKAKKAEGWIRNDINLLNISKEILKETSIGFGTYLGFSIDELNQRFHNNDESQTETYLQLLEDWRKRNSMNDPCCVIKELRNALNQVYIYHYEEELSTFMCECGGDFSIIQDKQLRGLLKKGPKYRIPSKIDFIKCREVLKEALDNYTKRWCKSEGVESHSLNDWKNLILDITDIRIDNFHKNPHLFENPSSRSQRYFKSKLRNLHEKFVFAPADKAANNTIII
ncbi:hypothetical protein FSP39_024732 [Pinctada imbricata]|uniref:Centrosomal protein CEP104 Zn finger domain-containing protein n=1 Tax=Pinctada imbricata TaxID=66713 RepID=A0AA88YGH6_PINIB|nr:hypothetical protein FSP39_024732 [Pinctada imbricata]